MMLDHSLVRVLSENKLSIYPPIFPTASVSSGMKYLVHSGEQGSSVDHKVIQ